MMYHHLFSHRSFVRHALAGFFFAWLFFAKNPSAEADVLTYTSRSAFDVAASSNLSVDDMEAYSVSNVASSSSLGSTTFTYSLGSISLRVVDSIVTTSGTKSLGSDDRDMLADGDSLDFSFAPRTGFGFYVISRDALVNGDVRLTAAGSEASLLASATQVNLGTNGFAWFLGVQSNDGATFTSASLTTHGGGGQFNFNLDDFASVHSVPEPSALWLFAVAAGVACRYRQRSHIR